MNKVVVTGLGIFSCLGTSLDEVFNNLKSGKIGYSRDYSRKGFYSDLTGKLPILPPAKRMSLATQYAVEATKQLDIPDYDRVGLIYGNDSNAEEAAEYTRALDAYSGETRKLHSGTLFKCLNSSVTMNLSSIFNLEGTTLTVSAACASSAHAIGLAYILIKHGYERIIVVGGAQEVSAMGTASFDTLRTFSKTGAKPFSKDRDGLVPSGGAASLILESEISARLHNRKIYAEVVGYGTSTSPDIAAPNLFSEVRCMKDALFDAGITAKDIDYINAHATGTILGDTAETNAILEVFGEDTPVTSTKGQTGHEMWMAGASELIYSILMMNNNCVVPQVNDTNVPINIVHDLQERPLTYILSNSFGFGGTNCSLILRKYERDDI